MSPIAAPNEPAERRLAFADSHCALEHAVHARTRENLAGLPQYKHLDVEVESPADEIEDMEAALAATHGETSLPPPTAVVSESEQRGGTETGVL